MTHRRDLKGKMEEMGVYKQLSAAPHKSIFLTADPRLIVYEECHRLVKDNNDYDFFLQTVRNSFRCIFNSDCRQFVKGLSLAIVVIR